MARETTSRRRRAARRAFRTRRDRRVTIRFLISAFLVLGLIGMLMGWDKDKKSEAPSDPRATEFTIITDQTVRLPTPTPFYIYYDRDNGDAAGELQRRLLELGYYTDEPNSRYDTATARAVMDFELVCGLPETGIADDDLLEILFADDAPANYKVYINLRESTYHLSGCAELGTAFRICTLSEALRLGFTPHDCVTQSEVRY